jgi:short-subunit dehydrogenase
VSATTNPAILVVGAGPGLGMSVARRFGRAGHPVALLSRNAGRHVAHLASLRADAIDAVAVAADVTDPVRLRAAVTAAAQQLGPIGTVYYGPGATDPAARPAPILHTRSTDVDEAMRTFLHPAIDLATMLLPDMIERGSGALLFATGLGAVLPLPGLGALALTSAALRTYALTLNAALADTGVYAGALVIGGLIAGGDIHRHAVAAAGSLAGTQLPTLDPGEIADAGWELATTRKRPEAIFNALA